MLAVVHVSSMSMKSRSVSAVGILPTLGRRKTCRIVVGQMRVVVYVTAIPVPTRYRYRFPVVRHDVDRLAVSVIELQEKRITVADVHG